MDEQYEGKLGGLTFRIRHTPGETPDHLTVWIPEYRTAFPGGNYYGSFPNIYTLRGTEPRWALDYVESLEKVMALEPELLLSEAWARHSRPAGDFLHVEKVS